MDAFILASLVLSALGSGMMAGLFCSFSSFVMRALARIPPAQGIAAMQSINLVIVRPAFLSVFLGTGIAAVLAVVLGWERLDGAALAWATAGCAVYVTGSIIVTIACNVPLNDRLAAVDAGSEAGLEMWRLYLLEWTRWNHLRSLATVASTVMLLMAVHAAGSS